jgi:hypothetical protein
MFGLPEPLLLELCKRRAQIDANFKAMFDRHVVDGADGFPDELLDELSSDWAELSDDALWYCWDCHTMGANGSLQILRFGRWYVIDNDDGSHSVKPSEIDGYICDIIDGDIEISFTDGFRDVGRRLVDQWCSEEGGRITVNQVLYERKKGQLISKSGAMP